MNVAAHATTDGDGDEGSIAERSGVTTSFGLRASVGLAKEM